MSDIKNQCSLCTTTHATVYKLDGRKCKDEDIHAKLRNMVGMEYDTCIANMIRESHNICRTCFSNVIKMSKTRELYTNNIKMFISGTLGPGIAGDASDHTYHNPSHSTRDEDTHMYNEVPTCIEHGYSMKKNEGVCQVKRNITGIKERKECTEEELEEVISMMPVVNTSKDADNLFKIPVVMNIVKKNILEDLTCKARDLASKQQGRGSVLIKKKSVENICVMEDLLAEIFVEMNDRLPFLLEVFQSISKKNDLIPIKYGPLCTAYAVLMFAREPELSLFQRLTTLICIKGHIEDMALSRLNRLGITMSTSTKIRLLDECGHLNSKGLVECLQTNPLLKITGDNLDIYIKAANNKNKDLHLFATNAISCRIANPNMSIRLHNMKDNLVPEDVLLDENRREILRESYIGLLSRILSDLKEFKWVNSITPKHIPHPYQREMAEKSQVFQMPLLMQNEAKYDDCIKIMTSYEEMVIDTFTKAHGSADALKDFQVVVGGDQMTRVRLEGAKNLRMQAPTPETRFDHLKPIVCEMWHMKQDFLEKLYKQMYHENTKRQVGTLSYFKNVLRKSDVNGKVKSNFQSHANLLTIIVKNLIVEQFLSFFGMENENDKPTENAFPENIQIAKNETKTRCLREMFSNFFDKYGYLSTIVPIESSDYVMKYCNQLCIWGIHFLELEDTASEGDVTRIIPNLSHNMPFFYSHSCLSKYLVECIDYVLKAEFLSSQLDRMRILEGSFVNVKGGVGNNIEADLVQEHHIKYQKELIRNLGANKSEEATIRATSAANVITQIVTNCDVSNTVIIKYSRHTKTLCTEDDHFIKTSLR